jgi:hypothetical protein
MPGGGTVSVVFSGSFGPPFDLTYSGTVDTDNPPDIGYPVLSGTATKSGQVSVSAVTPEKAATPTFGGEVADLGGYFSPMGPGTLTISASPTYSFEWLTNSLNTAHVLAQGILELIIFGSGPQGAVTSTSGNPQVIFSGAQTGQIQSGLRSNVQASLSTSFSVVPSFVYSCFLQLTVYATGEGWPGSLAVAKASASVPSIDYEFVGNFPPPPKL